MTHRRPEDEKERLAAALRANLARRKAQARQRQADEPRQVGEPRQRREVEEPEAAQLRPTEGAAEPGAPAKPGGSHGETSHDSAGFVGEKPSG
jgi:hypothetical protein